MVAADGHKDTLKVKEILDKYNAENDDVAERYIRRLSCWGDIREKYLQKDRKVEYEYTYTIKSFTTDRELLEMYEKRPTGSCWKCMKNVLTHSTRKSC